MPRISVLLPAREAETFLEEAVQSILNQTFRDFELSALYAPSGDGTLAVLEKLARRDRRVKILETHGPNLAADLNEGLRVADGEFIARMDADDVSLPDRFARQTAEFQARPGLGLLGCSARYIDAAGRRGRRIAPPRGVNMERALYWGCPVIHSSVMMRRSVSARHGGYRPFFQQAEDYDLWLRLHGQTEMDNLPDVLLLYRLHGGNSIRRNAPAIRRYAFLAQAAWLSRRKTGRDPLDNPDEPGEPPDPASLPLSETESAGLYGRILAGSTHLLGDERDDPEGNLWWPWVKKIQDKKLRREVEFFCAMRAARFYGMGNPVRCLRHCLRALAAGPDLAAGHGLKLIFPDL
ncbi:MAG: glycosyltransferase [Desulfovibrio sp.]|nr:glycosyltransferase [Desulfovibrio sp.]